MYSNRKSKSSLFLRDDSYPERILSRHKYNKRSGLYAFLKSRFVPSSFFLNSPIAGSSFKHSQVLLQRIPQLYSDNPLDRENIKSTQPDSSEVEGSSPFNLCAKDSLDQRGLQEMEGGAFTNGLLKSGHRYFRIL